MLWIGIIVNEKSKLRILAVLYPYTRWAFDLYFKFRVSSFSIFENDDTHGRTCVCPAKGLEANHFYLVSLFTRLCPLIGFYYIHIYWKDYCVPNFLPLIAWFDPFCDKFPVVWALVSGDIVRYVLEWFKVVLNVDNLLYFFKIWFF